MRTIRSRRGRRSIALAIAASMALPVSAAAALPETSATVSTVGGAAAPEAEFEKTAFATAARTGQRVEIIDRREETAEFFANPDGSTTRRSYATPKWTRLEGQWRTTDPTLVKKPDGSIAPAAPAFSIAFSGGGAQPLATMVKKGKKLALSWPTSLPEPVINGDTATYRSVLPGVDLRLIAEVDGFAQHLIVNTPEAATNPALRSIALGVETHGVTLTETADHRFLAKDEAGETVFSAPAPKMWEQPPTASEEQQTAAAGMSAMMSSAEEAESEVPSSAPVAADVSGNTLTLTPDAGLLATADQFPLIIDPPFSGGYREKWAVVYSATPSAAYPNGSGWNSSTPADEPRVGFNGDGNTRSFFAMNTNGLQGATITGARFAVIQTHSWACSASTTGPVELWSAKDITTTPTWNSQGNYWGSRLDSDPFPGFNQTYCPENEPGHEFTSAALTDYVQQAANSSWDPLVFGLRVPDSYLGDVNSFKRFRNNPVLEVDYNYKPTVDASAAYEGSWAPSGDGNKPVPCGTAIGNSGIALTAKVADRDGGQVKAVFSVKNANGTAISFAPNMNYKSVTNGQWASATMPSKNLPNGTYTWSVYADDGEGPDSAPTAACSFTVDTYFPKIPVTVLNTDGSPADEDGTTTNPDGTSRPKDRYQARKPVTLRLTHPTADVVGYCWAMDHFVSVDNTRCSNGTWVNAGTDANNTATITVTPSGYPYSTFWVVAYDAADNHSPVDGTDETVQLSTTPSEFVYEPGVTPFTQGISPHDRRGDLNGDGYSDFVATDTDGKLSFYAGNGTLGTPAAGRIVGTGGWGGSLIAHGGDLQNFVSPTKGPDSYEDFVVRLRVKDDDGTYRYRLFLYPGNGMGSPWVYSRQEIVHSTQDDWLGLRQIVLPGNIDGKPGNDLITVECIWDDPDKRTTCVNAELRLYSGRAAADGTQDQTAAFSATSTTLGTWGWRDFTNLAVDNINRDPNGYGDLVARDPATNKLWLYPGEITGTCPACTLSFSYEHRTEYGSGGWNQRPYLTSPGNIQGVVKDDSVDEDGTNFPFKRFEPTAGEEFGDFWATTPADPDTPIQYMDGSGNVTSRLCPTGCLLTYPGGATWHGTPRLAGTGGWATVITGIF
ncbi:VCBS repeat-containing protein [Streptomyces sp. NPDC002825]|uniref:VCBS repeat-containing protein n=1 Tax=Streptomyces sp. NPDC002825 TaxID=3154666 RepID=UPI003324174D